MAFKHSTTLLFVIIITNICVHAYGSTIAQILYISNQSQIVYMLPTTILYIIHQSAPSLHIYKTYTCNKRDYYGSTDASNKYEYKHQLVLLSLNQVMLCGVRSKVSTWQVQVVKKLTELKKGNLSKMAQKAKNVNKSRQTS